MRTFFAWIWDGLIRPVPHLSLEFMVIGLSNCIGRVLIAAAVFNLLLAALFVISNFEVSNIGVVIPLLIGALLALLPMTFVAEKLDEKARIQNPNYGNF